MATATATELVQEGQTAPNFTLNTSKGSVSLSDYRGQQNVLLYFMREFSCAACRSKAVALGRMYGELQAAGVEVITLGGGELAEADKLAALYKLPFPVAADTNRAVYENYGLHKAVGLIQRSGTILIDKQGVVRYVHDATLPTGSLDKQGLLEAVARL